MKPLTLVIMAAGMGSRYGGLKQLDKLGPQGQTIMDYAILNSLNNGFNHIIFIIRKSFYKKFCQVVGDKYSDEVKVDYVFQEISNLPNGYKFNKKREKPWGTGHAILIAKDYIKNNFAVINADDFYEEEVFKLLSKNLQKNNNYCNIVYPIVNTLSKFGSVNRGVCTIENNLLVNIQEIFNISKKLDSYKSDSDRVIYDKTLVSMNCWGFTIDLFDYLMIDFNKFYQEGKLQELESEFLLPEIINDLIQHKNKKIDVLVCSQPWYGITYQEDRKYVCEQLKNLRSKNDSSYKG